MSPISSIYQWELYMYTSITLNKVCEKKDRDDEEAKRHNWKLKEAQWIWRWKQVEKRSFSGALISLVLLSLFLHGTSSRCTLSSGTQQKTAWLCCWLELQNKSHLVEESVERGRKRFPTKLLKVEEVGEEEGQEEEEWRDCKGNKIYCSLEEKYGGAQEL